ncbi:Protein YIM1 [Nakaseomyces bracarensis]|uniref:Protein YIM1 n=1 Tax=Nakaseomyces bracarensis TaxID=273131 RepID=A0ABR4NYY2_9SACH
MAVVKQRSVVFTTAASEPTLITKDLDLDNCYKEDEIVIHVKCCALNPIDVLVHGLSNRLVAGTGPKTFSRDFSGVIVRKGKNVDKKWNIDDEVNGMFQHLYGEQGTFSDYFIMNPAKNKSIGHINKFPDNTLHYNEDDKRDDWALNAAYPLIFGTAETVLLDYVKNMGPESRILVIGASTQVSNALVQIAKNDLNIGTLVGVCNENSFEYNNKFGWDHLVSYNGGKTVENVRKLMKTELNNQKFDLIFDSVGNSEFFPIIDEFLKPKSEGSYFVTVVGDNKSDYKTLSFFKAISISTITRFVNPFRCYNYSFAHVLPIDRYMIRAHKMIADKRYEPIIDHIYELDQYREAIDRLKSNRAKGKVVIRINE